MFGGLSRSPNAISNIPTNGYVVFPNSEDNGNWYSKDWKGNVAPIGALNAVMGSQRSFGRKQSQQNSTSKSFSEYLSININNNINQTVKHEIFASFVWGYASASSDFRARLLLNGQQIGDEFRVEPKDSGTDQRNYESFMDEIILEPGNNVLSLEFASSANGTQSRMYSAKLRSMRVE